MSKPNKPESTSDKMIDRFKDKADQSVDDAREGETDDNPLKETIRDKARSDQNQVGNQQGKR